MIEEYINKKSLIETRFWTEGLIKKFLAKPDKEMPNPYYKKAANVQLFLLKKVNKIEATESFRVEMEKVKKRKISAEQAIKTKKTELFKEIDKIKITIPLLSKDELFRNAISHYNEMNYIKGNQKNYTEIYNGEINEFLIRVAVNYLRHCLSDYEKELNNLFGKVGKNVAVNKIRVKVYNEISFKYPYLKAECVKQKIRRLNNSKL